MATDWQPQRVYLWRHILLETCRALWNANEMRVSQKRTNIWTTRMITSFSKIILTNKLFVYKAYDSITSVIS